MGSNGFAICDLRFAIYRQRASDRSGLTPIRPERGADTQRRPRRPLVTDILTRRRDFRNVWNKHGPSFHTVLNLCGLASLRLSVRIGEDLEGNAKAPRRK